MIYNLIIGNNSAKDVDRLNVEIVPFFSYILVSSTIAYFTATYARAIVIKNKLYERWPILGIYNKWYYLLKPNNGNSEKISVWLDLLVESKDGLIIYRGFLSDFWLDREGGIKELHLEDVRRRLVRAEDYEIADQEEIDLVETESQETLIQQVDKRYYYIPGELFIIKYDDVKNMNITYFEEVDS